MAENFTKMLYELVVEKQLGLKESLEIISKSSCKSGESKTATFLLEEILKGGSFSNSLRKCPYVNFDDVYISFVNFAERTGNIRETIDFLYKRWERGKERAFKLIEVGIYPGVVVCLAGVGCILLKCSNLIKIDKSIFLYLFFLIIVCIGLFLGIKKLIGENKLYESFLAIGFLLKAGVSLYDCVNCGAQIMGINSKKGQDFQLAGEKLLLGMDLENAFSLGRKYSDAFFFADKGGGRADVFEKLANWIGEYDEKRRKICFSLIEPLFILVTGVFLIILVTHIFLPFINQLTFI